NGPARRRFATAALPHQSQRLPLVDVKCDAVYGAHGPNLPAKNTAINGKMLFQVPDADQGLFLLASVLLGHLTSTPKREGSSTTVSQRQQADCWSRPVGMSGGFSSQHLSMTYGQRGANGQWLNSCRRSGGRPSIEASRCCWRASTLGNDCRRPRV